jgi:glycosyltransferase involved in cell wall biosynthesis
MKISILTVTHERPEFIPWLLWNFERQIWHDKELIVVDSSDAPTISDQPGVTVIHAPGANVPAKRNIALDAASGDAITWLDDDDWRHPQSLIRLAAGFSATVAVSGGRWSWFVDLATGRVNRFCDRRGLLFNCSLVETAVAQAVRFDESEARGSDLTWMAEILKRPFAFTYDPLCFFLCHDRNLGNLASIHHFNREIDDIKEMVGGVWPGTGRQMAALRRRLWK